MKFLFVSAMAGEPWGGSEELWSQSALYLHRSGHRVSVSVRAWPRPSSRVVELQRAGIPIVARQGLLPLRLAARAIGRNPPYPGVRQVKTFLSRERPDFICLSQGVAVDDLPLLECIASSGIPWCNLAQANAEWLWPNDRDANRILPLLPNARRWFFVSEGNRRLFEAQIGMRIPNAEIVRNPFKVDWDALPSWPSESTGYRLACVGRLDPHAKGQDLLLQVLADPSWHRRPLRVSFFGSGPMEQGLRRLTGMLGLDERVSFHGRVENVESIWAEHHALVLFSRCEGLPLALIEAMLCGRMGIVTDVAGNAEILQDDVCGFVALAPTLKAVSDALDRAWVRRAEWRILGEKAREIVRKHVPADPVMAFSQRLLELASTT